MASESEQNAKVDVEPEAAPPVEENPEVSEVNDEVEDAPEASDGAEDAPKPRKVTAAGVKKCVGHLILGLVGIVLAMVSTMVDLAIQGLVSRRGGVVMFAALTATRATVTFASSLFSFIFIGGMALISKALGEGDDLKAGRYARLLVALALAIGLLGTVVLVAFADEILSLFHHEAVAQLASGFFRLLTASFSLAILTLALQGILLGFLYVHVVVVCGLVAGLISLAVVYPLFTMTDLGLTAFALATAVGAASSLSISLAYLWRQPRRRKFGLDLGLRGIGLAEIRELGRSMGCLAFRSVVSEMPYTLSVMWSIRLSPVHGAVFQFLLTKSSLVDRVATGLAVAMNFTGSRLWAGQYHSAFWNLLSFFLLWCCTPLAVIVALIELLRGQDSLANTFANHAERVYFDAVMTKGTFGIYIALIVARAYYAILEQTMVAMQKFWQLALVQGLAVLAFFCVAYSGYAAEDFAQLFLGMLVFGLVRIAGGLAVVGRTLRLHPWRLYKKGTATDPDYALKQTIDDPSVLMSIRGQAQPKPKGKTGAEFELSMSV